MTEFKTFPNEESLCEYFSSLGGWTDPEKVVPLKGASAHEVAVGPVHAGVIEPGHFRFQCKGENVYNLQIFLGYQHRGVEDEIVRADGMIARQIALAETIIFVNLFIVALHVRLITFQSPSTTRAMHRPFRGLLPRAPLPNCRRRISHRR